jgi:hypothetical protein
MYSKILDEVLSALEQDIRLGRRFTFQQDPKHTAKATQEWLWVTSLNVLEWHCQNLDMNWIEHFWRDLKISV